MVIFFWMHQVQISLARCDKSREWLPPNLFKKEIAVILSIRRRTEVDILFEQNACKARNAAFISSKFMCSDCSEAVHGPPIFTPWQLAPQPRLEASDSMVRSH